MAKNVADDVVLGLDTAAWAFSPADQTSPALAARAGALFDTQTAERVTELRIHGVSGSNGPTMLEHPTVLQVAGDSITGFYRRWNPGGGGRPSVGWKLEAYSWGGLTQRALASASWLVLAPFMIYNLAHFMLPAEPDKELRQPAQPGPGSEPGESRGYQPGDDVRRMDWAVTARTTHPHVRQMIADRELETWLVVDMSASLDFGTTVCENRALAVAAAAAITFLNSGGGNRLGAIVATGATVTRVPARSGRQHEQTLLRTIATTPKAPVGVHFAIASPCTDSTIRPYGTWPSPRSA